MLPRGATLPLVARLADPAQRRAAAQHLAQHLGAEDLLIFVPDPETGTLLPAPGFPQTLPRGRQWRTFLAVCATAGEHTGTLPFPTDATLRPAFGVATGDAVLVLLGGQPPFPELAVVRDLLPLLTAAFHGEHQAALAQGRAAAVAAAAANAQALAATLDLARRELQEALRQAEDAVRLRDEFLSAVAHDLRTPLTTMQGMTELVRRRAQKESTPATDRLLAGLETIERTSRTMAAMVRELFDLSQLQIGRELALNRTPTELGALVRDVVRDTQHTTRQHTVRIDAPAHEVMGLWDQERLERALSNVLANAVKYSPDGGVITVRVREDVATNRPGVVITVADEGLGIAAADLPHLFERFYRAPSVRGSIRGTGLGLAGVRQIVEQHGGVVTLASVEGEGTTVTVRLPLTDTAPGIVPAD